MTTCGRSVSGTRRWSRTARSSKCRRSCNPRTAPGHGREVVLVQKLKDDNQLLRLLTYEEPESYPEDSWMTKALTLRDQWESRLLRTAPWSPLW